MLSKFSWVALACLATAAIFTGVSAQAKEGQARYVGHHDSDRRRRHPAVRAQQASGGPEKIRADKILLYVHGATYPSETAFDLPIEGKSMMDLIAARGYDVYLGGHSRLRPLIASSGNEPAARRQQADRPDKSRREGLWDGGGLHPEKTRRFQDQCDGLVMGHLDGRSLHQREQCQGQPPRALRATVDSHRTAAATWPKLGAYRLVSKDSAKERWLKDVPENKKADLIPPGVFDAWAKATWATDPDSVTKNPGMLRAPNGVIEDTQLYWGAGKALFDPGKITVPTIILHAEWDADLPSYLAQNYVKQLKNAPYWRFIEISEGTHTVMMEKNRMQFFRELMNFLDEEKPLALN